MDVRRRSHDKKWPDLLVPTGTDRDTKKETLNSLTQIFWNSGFSIQQGRPPRPVLSWWDVSADSVDKLTPEQVYGADALKLKKIVGSKLIQEVFGDRTGDANDVGRSVLKHNLKKAEVIRLLRSSLSVDLPRDRAVWIINSIQALRTSGSVPVSS